MKFTKLLAACSCFLLGGVEIALAQPALPTAENDFVAAGEENVPVGATSPTSSSSDSSASSMPSSTSGSSTMASDANTPGSGSGQSFRRRRAMGDWSDLRVAVRAGQDRVWKQSEFRNAIGADASFAQRNVGSRFVRFETGATSSYLSDSSGDYRGFNFHGTFFPALQAGTFIVGPRALVGGSKTSPDSDVAFDAGGEGRAGVEVGNFTIFASAGRTIELTRVGLDLGATF